MKSCITAVYNNYGYIVVIIIIVGIPIIIIHVFRSLASYTNCTRIQKLL